MHITDRRASANSYSILEYLKLKLASKKDNHRMWQILKGCCETDASNLLYKLGTAQQILNNAKLFPVEGSLKMVADVDGNIYNIPNFCINDPLFVKEYKVDGEQPEKLVEVLDN